MKSILFYILFLLSQLPCALGQFQGIDTLFNTSELIFFSNPERNSFRDYLDGNPDYLALIAHVNPDTDSRELGLYRERVNEIIEDIRSNKFDQLNEVKKIDRIEKYVSNALLVNYKNEAAFDDLFILGDFNYFTAAAIYSFILDRLGIPFEIYELPTHVYLLAYPETERIIFETTRPGYQFFMFDHETRTNFVKFIHEQGVIDNITYQNNSTRDLFQQYYFADYGLSIREMIGMLYLNSAVEYLIVEQTQNSYSQLEKAFICYPSYKSQYMLLAQLNRYLINMDYRNLMDLGYLIKASRLINYGISRELMDGFLFDIVEKILVQEEDTEGFKYIYEYLQKYIQDRELIDNFTFYYLYESGRLEFNNTRYSKALDFLEPAHKLRPEDEHTQDLLTRSLGGYSILVSPARVLEKIQLYDTAFSAISDEGIYLMVKLQTYLSLFGEAFQLQDGKDGELYMAEFENLMGTNPEIESDNTLIGKSYSSAAIYYYRQGQLIKSRQVIEKGLIYAPDNIELKLKLASFK
jgi:hypothetical protein